MRPALERGVCVVGVDLEAEHRSTQARASATDRSLAAASSPDAAQPTLKLAARFAGEQLVHRFHLAGLH